jgi:DNA-binding MarR family transcriptional regulator
MTLRIVPAIHRATHAVALLLDQAADLSVTQAEAHVLSHLGDRGAATIGEIHKAFGHKRSTLTSVLDRLEARQLVTRGVNAEDRRSFVVSLTRQGRSLAAKVSAHLERLEADVRKRVSRTDLEAFHRVAAAVAELAELGKGDAP